MWVWLPGAALDGLGLVQDHVLPLYTLEIPHILHHLHTHTRTHIVTVHTTHTQWTLILIAYQLVASNKDMEWSILLVQEFL